MPKKAKSIEIAGVDAELMSDYLEVRKAKRGGALTQTAANGIIREADKAGISTADALRVCCEMNWIGFRASWYDKIHG